MFLLIFTLFARETGAYWWRGRGQERENIPLGFAAGMIQLINSAALRFHRWSFIKKGLIPEESNL